MPAQILTCVDCNKQFEFSEREQKYFANQNDPKTGLSWPAPKRCIPCRRARKAKRESY